MIAVRAAFAALLLSAALHGATLAPVWADPESVLGVLSPIYRLTSALHLSTMGLFAFAAFRWFRGDIVGYDLMRSFSRRQGFAILATVLYVVSTVIYCAAVLDGLESVDAVQELRATLRMFSAVWILFLGIAWLILRQRAKPPLAREGAV